jgi:hypothetical protein
MVEQNTWKEVSEEEKEIIRTKAKELLNDFSDKLKDINGEESHFENELGLREGGKPWTFNEEFRSTMISNAPFVEDEFLVSGKGILKK